MTRKYRPACIRALSVPLLTILVAGCGIVGWKYDYGGHPYTMTKESSDYHRKAIADVRGRFGDPQVQDDPAKLRGACELLQKYSADAPDPGQFTSARELLDADAHTACGRATAAAREASSQAEQKERRARAERNEAERERKRTEEQTANEKHRLTAAFDRATQAVAACDETADARAARKRHASILEQHPGQLVQKQCSPRRDTLSVKAECKDANGFVRPCTKTVQGADVTGYSCPKSMDAEVVQLGLFELDLLDGYPYPADRSIRVRDAECDTAKANLAEAKEKLERLTSAAATPTEVTR